MSFVGKTLVGVAIVGIGLWAASAASAQSLEAEHSLSGVIVEPSAQPVEIAGPKTDGPVVPDGTSAAPAPAITVHPDGAHSVDDTAAAVTSAKAGAVAFDQAAAAEFAAAVPVEPTFGAADGRTVTVAELSSLTEEQQRALLETVQSGHGESTTAPAP